MKLPDEEFSAQARRLFPKVDDYWSFYDYDPIINDLGEPLVNVTGGSYQGDYYILLKNESRYGFVVIGYGSCSGCDALQSCHSYEAVQELINEITANVKWFDSLQETKAYISDDGLRKVNFYYYEDEWKEFVSKVLALET